MVRPFAPSRLNNSEEPFAKMIEARLSHCGEWVRHIPCEGDPQWVVMNYQHVPEESNLAVDFISPGSNTMLWGYAPHFENVPSKYEEGDSVCPAFGSKFEIRGYLYAARKIDINHRGYLSVDVAQDDKCADPREDFFCDVSELSPC